MKELILEEMSASKSNDAHQYGMVHGIWDLAEAKQKLEIAIENRLNYLKKVAEENNMTLGELRNKLRLDREKEKEEQRKRESMEIIESMKDIVFDRFDIDLDIMDSKNDLDVERYRRYRRLDDFYDAKAKLRQAIENRRSYKRNREARLEARKKYYEKFKK